MGQILTAHCGVVLLDVKGFTMNLGVGKKK
jgi:hypothetical protein